MDTSDQAFQGGFGQPDDNSLDFACLLDGGLGQGPGPNDPIDNSDDQNSYAYGTGKNLTT